MKKNYKGAIFRAVAMRCVAPRFSSMGAGRLGQGLSWWLQLLCLALLVTGVEAGEVGEFRAARSVHLGYSAPEGLLFYNEVVVEKSVNGSYFMACGWNTGYFGIQQLDGSDDKVVLFSVWDPTKGDDPDAVK